MPLSIYLQVTTITSPLYPCWQDALKDTCHSVILSCCDFVFWKINLIYLSASDKDVTENILLCDTFPGQIRLIRAVNSEQHQYQYTQKYFASRHIFCEIRILAANIGADGCHARSTIFPEAFCQLLEFVQHIGYFSFARNKRESEDFFISNVDCTWFQ